MVNLLPKSVKWKLTIDYYVRFVAVVFTVLAVILGMGIALLVPSYLFARAEAEISAGYVATTKETAGLRERAGSGSVIMLLAERMKIIKDYERPPITAQIFSKLQAPLPSNVSLQKISVKYTGRGTGEILISGVAGTRNALLAYAQALQKENAFSGVIVPVSQLSLDKDIDFSLSFLFKIAP